MIVKFFATYRDITKCPKLEMPTEQNVLALLHALADRFGPCMRERILTNDGKSVGADAIVLVNGRHIEHLEGVHTPLKDEDTIALFPLVGGG